MVDKDRPATTVVALNINGVDRSKAQMSCCCFLQSFALTVRTFVDRYRQVILACLVSVFTHTLACSNSRVNSQPSGVVRW